MVRLRQTLKYKYIKSKQTRGDTFYQSVPVKISIFLNPYKFILLAPLVFVFHVAEEAPGFVSWVNTLIDRDITLSLFLSVNLTGFVIVSGLCMLTAVTKEKVITLITLAWLGFMMFANALFHILATLVYQQYAPGTITSVILYLPFVFWYSRLLIRTTGMKLITVISTLVIGAIPMAIHGYLIIFAGSRLF